MEGRRRRMREALGRSRQPVHEDDRRRQQTILYTESIEGRVVVGKELFVFI